MKYENRNLKLCSPLRGRGARRAGWVLLILTSVLCPLSSESADYTLPDIRVGVEASQYMKTIIAKGYDVEQLSILRLPGGGLRCRAKLQVTDGTNTYPLTVAIDEKIIAAAIGTTNLAAYVEQTGNMVGAILIHQAGETP